MENADIRYIANLILIVFVNRLPENTKTQSSCQMPSEMQRYNVDVHKLIYGAVKPTEGKKNSMRSKSFFHHVYRMKATGTFLPRRRQRDHAIWHFRYGSKPEISPSRIFTQCQNLLRRRWSKTVFCSIDPLDFWRK